MDESTEEDQLNFLQIAHEYFHQGMVLADIEKTKQFFCPLATSFIGMVRSSNKMSKWLADSTFPRKNNFLPGMVITSKVAIHI